MREVGGREEVDPQNHALIKKKSHNGCNSIVY